MVLNFGGLFEQRGLFQTADYKSAGSGQLENSKYLNLPNNASYGTIHTVTTGKTFYVTDIIYTSLEAAAGTIEVATGAAASEVKFLHVYIPPTDMIHHNFITPMKFSSGTRISAKTGNTRDNVYITLIGWEE